MSQLLHLYKRRFLTLQSQCYFDHLMHSAEKRAICLKLNDELIEQFATNDCVKPSVFRTTIFKILTSTPGKFCHLLHLLVHLAHVAGADGDGRDETDAALVQVSAETDAVALAAQVGHCVQEIVAVRNRSPVLQNLCSRTRKTRPKLASLR
jgi:hypothetical protein